MCTSIKFHKCMGRNYDYENSFEETIVTLPRGYHGNSYPVIGICTGFVKDYALLYDGMNSEGLCVSGLAFTGNAHYNNHEGGKINIPSYDFTLTVLGTQDSVQSARDWLKDVNITNDQYQQIPNSELHWLICDKEESIVVEQTSDGLMVYDNPYGVLTNNPPFPQQMVNARSMDKFIGALYYPGGKAVSRGTETVGVKGDTTSMSRFHRVHYYLDRMKEQEYNVCGDDVSTLHLLDLVKQTWGATPVGEAYEYTIYSAVYDMENLELMVKPYSSTMVKRICLVDRERRWKV